MPGNERRKVWLLADMVKDPLLPGKDSYYLNDIVAVYASQAAAEDEAKRLAQIGGTYSIFEHEVRYALLV